MSEHVEDTQVLHINLQPFTTEPIGYHAGSAPGHETRVLTFRLEWYIIN